MLEVCGCLGKVYWKGDVGRQNPSKTVFWLFIFCDPLKRALLMSKDFLQLLQAFLE